MEELCLCSKRLVDPQLAPGIFHGRPACSMACYNRAAAQEDGREVQRKKGFDAERWIDNFIAGVALLALSALGFATFS